jgi:hypothetical protein
LTAVPNDIQIRQNEVEDFTVEEPEYFPDAFALHNQPKILQKQTNPIILKADDDFKVEIPILKQV